MRRGCRTGNLEPIIVTEEVEHGRELNRDLEESKAKFKAADKKLRDHAKKLEENVADLKKRVEKLQHARRQFERWEVSMPCTVTHMGETIKGKVTNISLHGAFITELTNDPPPEKAFITVTFQVEKEEVEIKAAVDSSVVRILN